MRKRKKIIIIILVLAVLLGVGCWYLFFGGRIPDGSSEIMAGEDGISSPEQADVGDEAGGEQTEPEETAANPMLCTLRCLVMRDCIFRESQQTCNPRNLVLRRRNTMRR